MACGIKTEVENGEPRRSSRNQGHRVKYYEPKQSRNKKVPVKEEEDHGTRKSSLSEDPRLVDDQENMGFERGSR